MLKMIVAGLLGFFTLPVIFLVIWGMIEIGKWVGGLGMEPAHYWAGVFLPVAILVVFTCTIPFWT